MKKSLTIIGGGITGLATAYLAAKNGCKVRVLEGSPNFGGLLSTFEIGGNRLEYYYHHFFTHDAEINWFLEELGLKDKIFYYPSTMGIFRNGKIHDFNNPKDLLGFSPIGFFDKFRFAASSYYLGKFANWSECEDISCLEWFYKYAGKRATDSIWLPLLKIKFGPFYDHVPIAWMVGRLAQRMNSRKGGKEQLGYLEGSLQTLLDRLIEKLRQLGVELISDAQIEKLAINKGQLDAVITKYNKFSDKAFLFTLPTSYLTPLLKTENVTILQSQLEDIKYFGAACTVLEMDRPLSPVYWLNIADSDFPFGGVIEQTRLIPSNYYNGRHIAYLSRYFSHDEDFAQKSLKAIESESLGALPQIFSGYEPKQIKNVNVFRTDTAATICDLNFSKRVPACRTKIKNMYLASMCHIYPDERSCNNSIRVAAEACKVLGLSDFGPPSGASLSGQIGFNFHS